MDSQPIAVLLLFTSLAINIGLIMLQDSLKPRDEENAIEVQKASSNALTGMVLALLIAQPLAFASAVMGTEVFGWIIGMVPCCWALVFYSNGANTKPSINSSSFKKPSPRASKSA